MPTLCGWPRLAGIIVRIVIPPSAKWIAAPTAMSLALVAMLLASMVHPPGGATALIAAITPNLPPWHGFSFLVAVALGCAVMQAIALLTNNADPLRRYPTYWWG
jgi:CBS-domain-containing membrane protein